MSTKGNFSTIKLMGRVNTPRQVVKSMRASGKMTNLMEKASRHWRTVLFTKGNFEMGLSTDMGFISGLINVIIRGTGKRMSLMVKGNTLGAMGVDTMVNGKIT